MTVKLSKSISKSKNSVGLYRVSKLKDPCCKQGFRWRYTYYENGKSHLISATSIKKLKEKVLKQKLEWFVLDYNKVREIFPNDPELLTEDCFHCAYTQSNEDGLHCYRIGRRQVKGTDICEHYKKIDEFGDEFE